MSAVLKPVEEASEEVVITLAKNVSDAYTRYAPILNMSREALIAKALDAFVEEMHDAAAFLEGEKALATGAKTYSWEDIQRENGLL